MGQIHPGPASRAGKRFTSEQVRFLFQAYMQGNMKRTDVQEALGIGKSHFFDLLREYRRAPETFSISYERSTPPRLSLAAETEIRRELLRERKLVEDPRLPISGYNLPPGRLLRGARSSGEKGDRGLRDNNHGARQSSWLLSAPAQEEGA